MGHLLLLACAGGGGGGGSGGGLPPHALPAVADQLSGAGLVPRWLAWALTQQQPLFDRAFRRMFAPELRGAEAGAEIAARGDDGGGDGGAELAWALDRFWRRRGGAVLAANRSTGHLRSKSLGAGEGELSGGGERAAV